MTAGLAGLRFGEVAGLRLSEIDLNARTITVVHQLNRKGELGPAKTDGSVATLRVAKAVIEELRSHIARYGVGPGGLLFTSPTGKPIRYSNWRRRVLVPAVEAIGRPEIKGKTHVFRHTTGALVQREATTQVVQAAMRHSDYSTTFQVCGHMQAGINRPRR